jgi:hypothetical protein
MKLSKKAQTYYDKLAPMVDLNANTEELLKRLCDAYAVYDECDELLCEVSINVKIKATTLIKHYCGLLGLSKCKAGRPSTTEDLGSIFPHLEGK